MLKVVDLRLLHAFMGELFHRDVVAPVGYKFPGGGFFSIIFYL